MPRRLRFVPSRQLVAVTCRTLRGEFRLRPSRETNRIVAGAIGRALEIHDVRLHAVAAMSNHLHLLLTPSDARELSRFMQMVNRKIAFELNRRHGTRGAFWDGRYRLVSVTSEEAAQVAQLRYHLAQGCKEGLVDSPLNWPGVHCARALSLGERIEGTWLHRAKPLGNSRHQLTRHAIVLHPLPAWAHLDASSYSARVRGLIREIELEHTSRRSRNDGRSEDRGEVSRNQPFDRPKDFEPTPQPWVHAATQAQRAEFRDAYQEFSRSFRDAAQRLKEGELTVAFPSGCFPPPRPFVDQLPNVARRS